jgi:hypothetical protein
VHIWMEIATSWVRTKLNPNWGKKLVIKGIKVVLNFKWETWKTELPTHKYLLHSFLMRVKSL